jgi:hypothetical protein
MSKFTFMLFKPCLSCVNGGALSSLETALLFGNNVWIMVYTCLPNLSTYFLAVIRPWRIIMGLTEITVPWYCHPNDHRISPVFHFWNQAFQIVGFPRCSLYVNSSGCREQHEGWVIWPYCMRFKLSDVQVLRSWHHRLRIWTVLFSNQTSSNCSPTVDVGFVKVTLDRFCGKRVFSIQFCCHLCCSSCVIFLKQFFSMYDDLFLSVLLLAHCSYSLMLSSYDLCIPT